MTNCGRKPEIGWPQSYIDLRFSRAPQISQLTNFIDGNKLSARADNCPPVRSVPTEGRLMRSGYHLFPDCRGTTTIAPRMARPKTEKYWRAPTNGHLPCVPSAAIFRTCEKLLRHLNNPFGFPFENLRVSVKSSARADNRPTHRRHLFTICHADMTFPAVGQTTDLKGLCVIAHTIQGTASPNCPHVRTILVAPREFRPPAECLCAKTFAGT